MEQLRCPRHDVTLEPDGRCLLCERGIAEVGGLRQLLAMLAVLAVVAVGGISYFMCQPSANEELQQLLAGEAQGVSITIYMADW